MRTLLGRFAALPTGAQIAATEDFGPIIRGQWGIVTGLTTTPGIWRRKTRYACTFLGGIHVMATGSQITRLRHGCSAGELDDPLWFLQNRGMAERAVRQEEGRHTV